MIPLNQIQLKTTTWTPDGGFGVYQSWNIYNNVCVNSVPFTPGTPQRQNPINSHQINDKIDDLGKFRNSYNTL